MYKLMKAQRNALEAVANALEAVARGEVSQSESFNIRHPSVINGARKDVICRLKEIQKNGPCATASKEKL